LLVRCPKPHPLLKSGANIIANRTEEKTMKEIIATEQIFSPISNGKPIAIRYHYSDGTTAEKPIVRETERTELSETLKKTIEAFEKRFENG
jgi:hypothetical protein